MWGRCFKKKNILYLVLKDSFYVTVSNRGGGGYSELHRSCSFILDIIDRYISFHFPQILKQNNSRLENRTQLVTMCNMGPKVFINCAGFIRIDTTALGDRYLFLDPNPYFLIFNHLRLCLATAIHNLKWLKITHICLILD